MRKIVLPLILLSSLFLFPAGPQANNPGPHLFRPENFTPQKPGWRESWAAVTPRPFPMPRSCAAVIQARAQDAARKERAAECAQAMEDLEELRKDKNFEEAESNNDEYNAQPWY